MPNLKSVVPEREQIVQIDRIPRRILGALRNSTLKELNMTQTPVPLPPRGIMSYNDLPILVQIHKRFTIFFHNTLNNKSQLVHACGFPALVGSCSSVCNLLNIILPRPK